MRPAFLFALLGLVACDGAAPSLTDGLAHRGISVEVDARTVARGDTLGARVVNNSGERYTTGICYLVERLENGRWGTRDGDNGGCVFIAFNVADGAAFDKPFRANVAPGTIRLVERWDGQGDRRRVFVASPSIRVME